MNDLISRKAAIEAAMQDVSDKRSHDFNAGATRAANRIKSLPTVEAEPVRHGKWILKQEKVNNIFGHWNRWSCSCCGYVRTKGWATTSEGHKPNALICENCGAKMDERKEE